MNVLHIERAAVIGHDIGNMVAFAFAVAHQARTARLVMMDAPVPGIGPWEEILKNPLLWHFRFGGPDMERLVAGRERIYLDRFWNEFSAKPVRFPGRLPPSLCGALCHSPGACMLPDFCSSQHLIRMRSTMSHRWHLAACKRQYSLSAAITFIRDNHGVRNEVRC